MTTDIKELVKRLRERAALAATEGNMTATCDARYFSQSADALEAMVGEVERSRADKDGAYSERNQLVAFLTRCFPSWRARTDIPGWSPEWHGCVYIETPEGQLSWHYHDREAHLFAHLEPYPRTWDGHTTEDKYQRLARLQPNTAERDRLAGERDTASANLKGLQQQVRDLAAERDRLAGALVRVKEVLQSIHDMAGDELGDAS